MYTKTVKLVQKLQHILEYRLHAGWTLLHYTLLDLAYYKRQESEQNVPHFESISDLCLDL